MLDDDKKKWLRSIGAVNVEGYSHVSLETGHIFSKGYLCDTPIETLKDDYERMYGNRDKEHDSYSGYEMRTKMIERSLERQSKSQMCFNVIIAIVALMLAIEMLARNL